MVSFVSNIVVKKQKFHKALKLSILSIFITATLLLIFKIVNLVVLNVLISNTTKMFSQQNSRNKIEFKKNINFLKSNITLNDIKIYVPNGNVEIEKMILNVKHSFILPSTISIKLDKLSTEAIGGKKYTITPNQDFVYLDVFINNHFFKKNNFGGIQILKPTYLNINNDKEKNGHIKIDTLKIIKNDELDYLLMEQKGSLLLNNIDLIPTLMVVDRPFSWDIQLIEKTNISKNSKFDDTEKETYFLDIKKMVIDYGFSKVSISGTNTRDNKLQTADMTVIVDNDNKLLDAFFNLATQAKSNSNDVFTIKKMYLKLKNTVIPLLKQNSNNTNKQQLVLAIKKQQDKELSLNGILASDIAGKIIGK